ncbi:MAG TPA: hypothetical protein VEH27_16020 [Methylomirabilota bacterium]|nr:hypothetical protein [Methylomirabilota bacterium]
MGIRTDMLRLSHFLPGAPARLGQLGTKLFSLTRLHSTAVALLCAIASSVNGQQVNEPFAQPVSRKHPLPIELRGKVKEICIDRDGIVYIRSEAGVARLIDGQIRLDQSYRPLAGKIAKDLALQGGRLFYLFSDEIVGNRDAGRFVYKLPQEYQQAAVNARNEVLLSHESTLRLLRPGGPQALGELQAGLIELLSHESRFIAITSDGAYDPIASKPLAKVHGTTAGAFHRGALALGTTNGFVLIDPKTGQNIVPLQTRLPTVGIRALASDGTNLWAGTTQGVWRRGEDGGFRYFASRRWLDDDSVIDIALDPAGNLYALTETGVNVIEFKLMTLADKARWYDEKIRQRHIRYGFCAELRLKVPGDIGSAEMIDTDNDGTWSNYYMASQAFRFGATGDERARRNAWETFEALERLEEINPLEGFPSRTFERVGFKVSDVDRWHPVGDGIWDWKAHTSSDEIAAHVFGCATLYETTAKTPEEKQRIATFIGRIADHIIRNNWQLIDMDGKTTLWGRWNPEYLNGYPKSVFDRRLNSAQIIALLQFAHKVTGKPIYKEKAYELFERHGYLDNILTPMATIGATPGQSHLGITIAMEWNHSDDLLAFITYWVLHRTAFTEELRAKYAAAIRDHWEAEESERNPIWNFVYASTGAKDYGLDDALWTLRHFPLDMIDWSVRNSHRQDLTRLPENFRRQEIAELLPPDERRMTRWNGQPFIQDGGSGGHIELAGDEFLLPYWMGRYHKVLN